MFETQSWVLPLVNCAQAFSIKGHQNEAKNTHLHNVTIVANREGSSYCMLQAGWGCLAVARVFGIHRSTITHLAERYHATGSSNDRPRTGRPRVTTAAQDKTCQLHRLAHLRDRFQPATRSAAETIGTHHRPVSARTIRNRHFWFGGCSIVWLCYWTQKCVNVEWVGLRIRNGCRVHIKLADLQNKIILPLQNSQNWVLRFFFPWV